MRNRTNCLRAKHENEVEAQGSEKLPIKRKCQSLFTCSSAPLCVCVWIEHRLLRFFVDLINFLSGIN